MVSVARVAYTTVRTTDGPQDVAIQGIGTPDAIRVQLTRVTADDTATGELAWCWGITDGSTEFAVTSASKDNSGTSYSVHAAGPDLGRLYDPSALPGAFTLDLTVGFNQWITDGVRLDITHNSGSPGAAWKMQVDFFSGVTEAFVGTVATSAAIPGTATVAALDNEPDFVLTHATASTGWVPQVQALVAPGIAANDGADSNAGVFLASGHLQTTTATQERQSATYVSGRVTLTRPPPFATGPDGFIDNYTGSGFDFSNATAAAARRIIYLAIKLPGGVGFTLDTTRETPNVGGGTGEYTYTWPGHISQFLYTLFSFNRAVDTWGANAAGGCGSTDRISEGCAVVIDQNTQPTTNALTLADDTFINLRNGSGAKAAEATWSDTDPNGHKLTWSTVPANARRFATLSIEVDPLTLTHTALESQVSFGTHSLTAVLTHTALVSQEAFGTHTLTAVLGHVALESTVQFGTHALTALLAHTALVSQIQFGSHSIAHQLVAFPSVRLGSGRSVARLSQGVTMSKLAQGTRISKKGSGVRKTVKAGGTRKVVKSAGTRTVRKSHGK